MVYKTILPLQTMKTFFLTFFAIFFLTFNCKGQCGEVMPLFPGGENGLFCFIDKNINKEILNKYSVEGGVYTEILIDTTGIPTEFKLLRGYNTEVDSEFLRVLRLMPKWEPGRQMGKAVKVQFNLPLKMPYKNTRCTEEVKKTILSPMDSLFQLRHDESAPR